MGAGPFGPVADGDLVTGPPWTAPGAGVELVCGFTHEEYRGFPPVADPDTVELEAVAARFGLGPEAAGAYRSARAGRSRAELFTEFMSDALVRMPTTRVAEAHARAGGRTWLYDFAWRGPVTGAAHGIDVPFTFGDSSSRFAARLLGSPPPPGFATLSERLRTAWTSFAATGDPGWPRFDPERRWTRVWDTIPQDGPYPLADTYPIWAGHPQEL